MQHEYLVFFVRSCAANPGNWAEKKDGLDQIYFAFEGFRKEYGADWEAIHKAAQAWYKQFPPSDPVYASRHYNRMDERGVFFADNISGPNDGQYVYEVLHPVTELPSKAPSRGWVFPRESMGEKIADNRVHFGPDHTTVPNLKTYLKETEWQSLTSIRYVDGRAASKRLQTLFGQKVFTNPKDEYLLRDIYRAVGLSGDDIVLDAFSGSGSALHAVLELNRSTASTCRYIGVQVAEDLHESLKTAKGASKQVTTNAITMLTELGLPTTVAEIGKRRMRLVGEQFAGDLTIDAGFRVLKVDTTNMEDVLRTPDALGQDELDLYADSVKPDRTAEDVLFQVLLDWGLELTMPIAVEQIEGHEVFIVEEGALIACFVGEVSPDLVRALAKREPLRAVFRDSGFATDSDRINAEQIFAEVSPATDVKAI
jgi:adenine-specific DNA-methyltransferase